MKPGWKTFINAIAGSGRLPEVGRVSCRRSRAQREERINPRRAPRRNVAGQRRDNGQQHNRSDERGGVCRPNAVQHGEHEPREQVPEARRPRAQRLQIPTVVGQAGLVGLNCRRSS